MSRQAAKPLSEKGWSKEPSAAADDLAGVVLDAALEVHRNLGPGFVESVYEKALCHELSLRKVAFDMQVVLCVRYKGVVVGEGRADLLVGRTLLVELKALPPLLPESTGGS